MLHSWTAESNRSTKKHAKNVIADFYRLLKHSFTILHSVISSQENVSPKQKETTLQRNIVIHP
jgi:hypothetical protein